MPNLRQVPSFPTSASRESQLMHQVQHGISEFGCTMRNENMSLGLEGGRGSISTEQYTVSSVKSMNRPKVLEMMYVLVVGCTRVVAQVLS